MDRSREDEYAEGYRRADQQARRDVEPTMRLDRGEWPATDPAGPDTEPGAGPGTGTDAGPDTGTTRPPESRRRRAAVAFAAVAVTLVGGAFFVGRMFADGDGGIQAEASAAGADAASQPAAGGESGSEPYGGAVSTVSVVAAVATCQSQASVDAAGHPIGYGPENVYDHDLTTAWRCPGGGKGERLTLHLPAGTRVAEVGLVPGYAKTDPADGTDRYAQNNRITAVRWHFEDGTTRVQRMSGAAGDRSMRTLRLPVTATSTVVVEVLRSRRGPRDTIAVSEVRIAAAAG